jgi:diguanylate cyclase (GGDEF)-like protein
MWLEISVLAAGFTWAPLPVLFFNNSNLLQMYQAALLIAISGSAMSALSAVPSATLSYVLPMLAPLTLRLVQVHNPVPKLTGWMILLFIGFQWLVSLRMRRMLTEKSYLRAEAVERSLLDPLTELYNRRGFERHLDSALHQAKRSGHNVVIGYIDLDNFKSINDSHGHEAGDTLLETFAERLNGLLRPSEHPARIGGDEFAIILSELPPDTIEAHLQKISDRIRSATREPFELDAGKSVQIGLTLGFAIFPDDGQDRRSLLKCADERMYAAKQRRQGE